MGEVIQLVKSYREAATLDQRLAIGDELLRRIAPDLQLFLLGSVQPDTAADLLQEILVLIVRGLVRFEGTTEPAFWAWCYRIARNKLADHFRGKSMRLEPMAPEEIGRLIDASASVVPLSAEDRDDLAFALRLLAQSKPDCLEFLWSHFVAGFDYGEIAEERGLSYDNTRMKVNRCLETAQALMAQPR